MTRVDILLGVEFAVLAGWLAGAAPRGGASPYQAWSILQFYPQYLHEKELNRLFLFFFVFWGFSNFSEISRLCCFLWVFNFEARLVGAYLVTPGAAHMAALLEFTGGELYAGRQVLDLELDLLVVEEGLRCAGRVRILQECEATGPALLV